MADLILSETKASSWTGQHTSDKAAFVQLQLCKCVGVLSFLRAALVTPTGAMGCSELTLGPWKRGERAWEADGFPAMRWGAAGTAEAVPGCRAGGKILGAAQTLPGGLCVLGKGLLLPAGSGVGPLLSPCKTCECNKADVSQDNTFDFDPSLQLGNMARILAITGDIFHSLTYISYDV